MIYSVRIVAHRRSGVAPEFVFSSVEPGQQTGVFDGHSKIGLAGSPVAAAEFEGDFLNRLDAPADKDLEQQLETRALESNLIETVAADQKLDWAPPLCGSMSA